MTFTINLSAEMDRKLLQAAARTGLAPEVFAGKLIEKVLETDASTGKLSPPPPKDDPFEEILADFRKEVEESGMTDDDLRDFFSEARAEVRAEKRSRRSSGNGNG